jgi:tetratricopeptide (TPR) repeat protein
LGAVYHALGELDQARIHYEQALVISSEVGDRRSEGNGRCNLGLLYQEQGRTVEARAQFDLALCIARETGHVRLAYTVLCNLGILLTDEEQFEQAVRHLEDAVKGAIASSDRRSEGQFRGYLALALAKMGRVDAAREMVGKGERLLAALADRLSHALLLCDKAEIEAIGSNVDAAAEATHHARRVAEELGCGPESQLCRRLTALQAAVVLP